VLTEQQQKVLNSIKAHIIKEGFPPTVREIDNAVGLNSPGTVHMHLRKLETMGYIKRNPASSRAIKLMEVDNHA